MRYFIFLTSLLFLCVFAGCGGPFPIKMTFTSDGKPLGTARISLIPDPSQRKQHPASGTTDADGSVVLKSGGEDGVYTGKYTITVSKTVEEWKPSDEQIAALKKKGINSKPHNIVGLVAEKYTRADFSDLKIEISYFSEKEFTFDLKGAKSVTVKQPAEESPAK
ncbi:MAG: carboxypeptidase-like regulatory domain-containing protein [Planctomycetaceae bacterium]|jgi:hypothetical protein|nr:carboxypeptidase-like regulatory domain-containing protein [Planctomycetaceae bacterium]